MGGGSTAANGPVHYAPYLETAHSRLLDASGAITPVLTWFGAINAAVGKSPYAGYVAPDMAQGFLNTTTLASQPSLIELFRDFLSSVDVGALWTQTLESSAEVPEIDAAIKAQSAILDEEIEATTYPRLLAGMRDIGAVMSTAMYGGKAWIEISKTKQLNAFGADLRTKAIAIAHERWRVNLDWNKAVANTYSDILKLYYTTKVAVDDHSLDMKSKDVLFDLGVLDHGRSAVGAMQGAMASPSQKNPSMLASAIGGAASGAAMGGMIGGPPGAIVGGVLGLAAGLTR